MDLGLRDKCVIVTGGSRGIGFGIAEACAKEGAKLAICGRSQASLDQAADALAAHGGQVLARPCDVSDAAALEAFLQEASRDLGGLHGLVNNPSGFGRGDTEEAWQASLEVDVMGVIRAIRTAAPLFDPEPGGSIVNIASTSGIGASGNIAYGAAKALLIHATQSYAKNFAARRIRVNAIAPGSIDFPGGLWDQRRKSEPEVYNATLNSIPFGRMGRPEEIGSVGAFLLSEAASWITGQTIAVDGGQNL